MSREDLELLNKKTGVVRRRNKRQMGLFIDATGLDRATRRMDKKVDLSRLVSGLTSGIQLEIARYYTLIPYEDDARQFAFLEAVARAGVEVITKRLPPRGVNRQVSMDVHIATDILSYTYGKTKKPGLDLNPSLATSQEEHVVPARPEKEVKKLITVVCPTRELSYAIHAASEQGIETSIADFGLYGTSDGWSGVKHWIDLSTSEMIWR